MLGFGPSFLQVLGSLRMLLMMKPDMIHSLSRHIAYGLHDLLKTNAANIHTSFDWYTLFTLLEVIGAGTNPPPVMQCRPNVDLSQVLTDAGWHVYFTYSCSVSIVSTHSLCTNYIFCTPIIVHCFYCFYSLVVL